MAHRRARLTPFGRLLIVQRIDELGWSVAETAKAAGVSRATAHKWVRRYRQEGVSGLEDRTSAPLRCPHALPPRDVARILKARATRKEGPHQLAAFLGRPRSTIYGVLRRNGCSRLDHIDRPTGAGIRYERDHPGELLHVDVKKLGRIPQGGGWRMLGRPAARGSRIKRGLGYDYLHAAVDDHSRVAYVEVHPDERGETAARFLASAAAFFASHGVRVQAVMTDNAMCYRRSVAFLEAMAELGIRHVPIPPYHPRANGKVERFNRTLAQEWAYIRLYRSNQARLAALPGWVDFYNRRRSHTALGGRPPITRLEQR
jgi:transposase InsO family protein